MRGDCGYGNEEVIDVCEQRDLRYLLRLRKTANVKRLIERLFRCVMANSSNCVLDRVT